MAKGYKKNITPKEDDKVLVVKSDVDAKDGHNKCPKCGSTDIILDVKSGKLRCNFCRFLFEAKKVTGFVEDISSLDKEILGSGAKDINEEETGIKSFKCSGCGAEVVIDTNDVTSARCHWCRSVLSVNNQIENGAIPDVVLPFKLTKEEAENTINKFVSKRQFFAHPKFKKEFNTDNIIGVYFPYMLIDANCRATYDGYGEHLIRKYNRGTSEHPDIRYDADYYKIDRDFDLVIEGLSVESKEDLIGYSKEKTNNIINSIMPFDTENCVKWDANYLRGYNSEKRDTNISELKEIVDIQIKDVCRHSCNKTCGYYDRGVRFDSEDVNIKGRQWKSAYLPVWLYSYQQVSGNKKLLHYVAVNARTTEVMGSVPIYYPLLVFVSFIIELLGIFGFVYIDDFDFRFLFLLVGFVYFAIIYYKYRNTHVRHTYEKETKTNMTNLIKKDEFIEHRRGLSNSRLMGANNDRVDGESITSDKFQRMISKKLGQAKINTLGGATIASLKDDKDE